MRAFKTFNGFLKFDTRIPNIQQVDIKTDVIPITDIILPERTQVKVLNVHEKGDFVRVQFYDNHPHYPKKYTIVPKQRLWLDLINRSQNTLFKKEK